MMGTYMTALCIIHCNVGYKWYRIILTTQHTFLPCVKCGPPSLPCWHLSQCLTQHLSLLSTVLATINMNTFHESALNLLYEVQVRTSL